MLTYPAHVRLGPPVDGRTLQELSTRERYRVNVVLVSRPTRNGVIQDFEPEPGLRLALHDLCMVVGKRESMNRFERENGLPE